MFRNPSIVLTLCVLLIGAAILLGNEMATREQSETMRRSAALHVETLSRSLRDQIGTEISALDSTLRTVSLMARQDGMDVAASRAARMVAARTGTPAVFFLVDSKGHEVWKSRAFELDTAVMDEHIAAARNYSGTPHISAARHHAVSGIWGIYLSLPVLDSNGELIGLAVAVLDAARFVQIYNAMNLGLGGVLRVVHANGAAIVRVVAGDLSAGPRVDAAVLNEFSALPGERCGPLDAIDQVGKVERISSYCNVEGYPLVAGIGIGKATALAPVAADIWRDRLIAILLVTILAGGAVFLRVLLARQQRTQSELRRSEVQFRAVFEQASVGIGIREVSLKPRWISVNQKLCDILGYSREELLQLTSVDITPTEDFAETNDYNEKIRSSELRSYSRQKRYLRKDGSIVWVDLSVAVVNGTDGKPQYLVSVIHDISDAVASRELLKESEERYRQIFVLTPLPMFLRGEESMKFVDANDACLEMYGYTREEWLKLTVVDVQLPDERRRFEHEVGGLPDGKVERLHKKHMRKNGEAFDVEIFSYPTRFGTESVRLALVRDITDQLQAEQQLRDSERRVALALTASGGALFDWDVGSGEVYLSESWSVMLGGERRETHTTFPELARLLHPDDQEAQRKATVALLKTGSTPLHTEFRIRNFRGDWIWIESRGSVTERGRDGRALRIRGTNVDITERKQVEMALRERDARLRESEMEIRQLNTDLERRVEQRTQALAAANRELESFSYSVSHDLRAPLRTIDGFSQIVLDEYGPKLDATGRGYLERVRAGSQRMAQLIDDLLELARVTRRELQVRQCDLTAAVVKSVRELENAEPDRNVRLTVADGMQVIADPGLLSILLDNLLRNAWKFTSRQAESQIEVGLSTTGAETVYFVRDNGVGFDMTYVGKLFGAFQRLHGDSDFQGTGIGLALVQRVIRRHGGQVWAEAEPGRGATFYFTFPQPVPDLAVAREAKVET